MAAKIALPTIAVLLIALMGCRGGDRPSLAPVRGRVTFDGQPLPQATVVFQSEHGQSSRGITDADGRYELVYLRDIRGAVLGRHTVAITTATENSPRERLPKRYHSSTELAAEVKGGENTFDFALQP